MKPQFSIGKKLTLGYGVLIIAIIINGILTIVTLKKNRKIVSEIAVSYTPSLTFLQQLYSYISETKMLIKNWVFIDQKSDTHEKLRLKKIHTNYYPNIRDTLNLLSKNWPKKEQEQLKIIYRSIENELFYNHQIIMNLLIDFEDYSNTPLFVNAASYVREDQDIVMGKTNEILENLNRLIINQKNKVEESRKEVNNSFDYFRKLILTMVLLLLFVALLIAYLTTNSIVNPVRKLEEATIELQKGNLDITVDIHSRDEIHILSDAFNQMIKSLNRSTTELKASKAKLEIHSEKLSFAILSLEAKERKLQELNATKDKFFSIIAHDLVSPFSTLCGISNLLLERYNDKRESEEYQLIHSINFSANHTLELLRNLLTWARSQSGTISFNPEMLNLSTIINETLLTLKETAKQKEIKIHQEIMREESGYAFGDSAMIQTVIRNIVSNAVKFTPIGGEIKIQSKEQEKYMEISISDSGIGINPDKLPKIFSIDGNYQSCGTQGERGTGLGLILCKEFVERNGGTIWVQSETGVGSTFGFTIPKTIKQDDAYKKALEMLNNQSDEIDFSVIRKKL